MATASSHTPVPPSFHTSGIERFRPEKEAEYAQYARDLETGKRKNSPFFSDPEEAIAWLNSEAAIAFANENE